MQPLVILQLLLLLMLANGTPVIAKKIFGDRYSHPLDGNLKFSDGRPLFGRSKTIRGILLAVLVTTAGRSATFATDLVRMVPITFAFSPLTATRTAAPLKVTG